MLSEIVIVRILLYLGIWYVIKAYCVPLFQLLLPLFCQNNYHEPNGIKSKVAALAKGGNEYRLENLKRLIRSEIYCLFATISGAYVLYKEYKSWPMDLLHHWSPNNQFLFEIAISHWIFSIIEDNTVFEEVISHMMVDPREKPVLLNTFMSSLFYHHLLTILAYSWSLYSQYLSALCVFGLLFEAPVLLLNIRDICVTFEEELSHPFNPQTKSRVILLWTCVSLLWQATRTLFCSLYPISLIFWRHQLVTVPIVSRLVYHFLGIMFMYVNIVIPHTVMRRYMLEDYLRVGMITNETRIARMKSYGINVIDYDEESEERKSAEELEGGNEKHEKRGTKLLGPNDVLPHNTPTSAWISIDNDVYDITDFLTRHPGGMDILLNHLGGDATKEFHQTGHSVKARKMLTAMKVGTLIGHSYHQTNNMANYSPLTGDLNSPYEVGKTYISWDDPILISYLFPVLSIVFCSALAREMRLSSTLRLYPSPNEQTLINSTIGEYPTVHYDLNVAAVYETETSISKLFEASVLTISLLLILSSLWCVLLNSFPNILKNIFSKFPNWIGVGYPLKYQSILTSFFQVKNHFAAVVLLLYLIFEWMVLSFGLQSHNHGLRGMRISFFLTFGIELMIRKLFFPSPFPEVNAPFKDPRDNNYYKHGSYGVIFIAACIDLFSLFSHANISFRRDLEQFNGTIKYPEFGFIIIAILLTAIFRSFFSKCCSLCLQTSSTPSDTFNSLLGIIVLAAIYGSIICWFSVNVVSGEMYRKPSALDLWHSMTGVQSSTGEESSIFLLLMFASLCLAFSLLSNGIFIQWSNRHFSTQVNSLLPGLLLWLFAPPIGFGRWICFLLVSNSLYQLSHESHLTLTVSAAEAIRTQTPMNIPHWIYAAKQAEDFVRVFVSHAIHSFITQNLINLSSAIAPVTQKYWTYPGPVMDLGPNCDYGMAYQINGTPQKKPGVFQCNVGYIGTESGRDYLATASGTMKMMKSLVDDPEAGNNGFIADVVAHFGLGEESPGYLFGKYATREINFSVWENDEASRAWYKKNNAHKELVKLYYNGGLSSFSAMIASLPVSTERPIRWDVRCRNCRMMVQGPDPKVCSYCGEKVLPMPYF